MTTMTAITRSARLSLVAIAAVGAVASSAHAADAGTRPDTSPRITTIAAPAPDGTRGKTVTCVGSLITCGPGGKFHAACDAQHGGYGGSNEGATGIPQTWSCTLP